MADIKRAPLFDARGNKYIVVSPRDVPGLGDVVGNPTSAARKHAEWASEAIKVFCQRSIALGGTGEGGAKPYWSNGLLVGPFKGSEGLGLIIVNTDGTIAERSGNGLTIFAHYLVELGYVDDSSPFDIAVFHPEAEDGRLVATCHFTVFEGKQGVWVDMGFPSFGPAAVGAKTSAVQVEATGSGGSTCVLPLQRINSTWTSSVFVNGGNPHCVTFPEGRLPDMEALHEEQLLHRLEAIANDVHSKKRPGGGEVCDRGVNLQWAKVAGEGEVEARVFERGEGPTQSSGSSAVAVAFASRYLGLVRKSLIFVRMPGGTAPIRFDEDGKAHLFGQASPRPYAD